MLPSSTGRRLRMGSVHSLDRHDTMTTPHRVPGVITTAIIANAVIIRTTIAPLLEANDILQQNQLRQGPLVHVAQQHTQMQERSRSRILAFHVLIGMLARVWLARRAHAPNVRAVILQFRQRQSLDGSLTRLRTIDIVSPFPPLGRIITR